MVNWKLTKRLLGRILVEGNFISSDGLERAVSLQTETNEQLGEILVRLGLLEAKELNAVLAVQRNLASLKDAVKAAAGIRELLGELLIKAGRITRKQLEEALSEQKRTGRKIGEILMSRGLITEPELKSLLDFQSYQGKKTPSPLRLGEILVASRRITREQLQEALKKQGISKKKIGEILVEAGYVTQDDVSWGINLQQRLVTAALIAVMSLAPMAASTLVGTKEAAAADVTSKLEIKVVIPARAKLKVIYQTPEFLITNADIKRGYVDIQMASRVEIKNNSPSGYLLIFQGHSIPVKEIQVIGAGERVTISAVGGSIQQPYTRGGTVLDLSYRFVLSEDARPGTYAWPLSMNVRPL